MFRNADGGPGLQIRGTEAVILWGYQTAAVCAAWSIAKRDGVWRLTATLIRREPVMLRQTPLLFTARHKTGQWCWDVRAVHVGTNELRATLGQPLQ